MVGPESGAPAGGRPRNGGRVRVLVCDDHEVLRRGLRTVLRRAPDLDVAAEAADADEALERAARTRPDVALVGLDAPGNVIRDLVAALTGSGVRVVLLGEARPDRNLVDALRAGARGYMSTTVSPDGLIEGVRAVARGDTVLDPAVTGELLSRLEAGPADDEEQGRGRALTARQEAVSELVAEGLTNAEIAERLHVSRATVKGHITVALRRLGLRDRTQLAIYVHRSSRPDAGWEAGPLSG